MSMIEYSCDETMLAIESRIKNIRFASDPRSEFLEVVKQIVEIALKDDLHEAAAPGYLSAAYWELMSTEKFRKERENNG